MFSRAWGLGPGAWIAYFQLALNTLPRCQAGAETAAIGVASGATVPLPAGCWPGAEIKNHAAGAWLPGHYSIV